MGSHNSKPSKAAISDYSAYAAYRVTEAILRLLPMEVVCIVGSCMGQIAYFLMPLRRAIVTRNLRIAYGKKIPLWQIKSLARKNFRHTGSNLIASIPASVISNEELKQRVEIEGLDNLLKALKQDKGCILLLAHMGNWEILTQLKILVPEIESLGSLYRPLDNPLLNRLIKRRRQSKEAKLFSRDDGFNKPIKHIKAGGTLGCIADQNAGKHGMAVPFFGKLSSMTNLPALLHRKTKAPIIPLSMCMTKKGFWKVVFKPVISISDEAKKDTYQVTLRCAQAYEDLMSESPADVLWMHNYWRGAKRAALKIRGQIPRKAEIYTPPYKNPFEVIIHTGKTITDDQLAKTLALFCNYRSDVRITLAGSHHEFPGSDACLVIDTLDPCHLQANSLSRLQDSMSSPFDCALDLSSDGAFKKIFAQAGIAPYFALITPPRSKGKNSHKITTPSSYKQSLEYFLECITPQS